MASLKQYKKRRKQLKADIQETKAHLKDLKRQLKGLRQEQQHDAIEHLDEYISQSPSLLESVKRLLKR